MTAIVVFRENPASYVAGLSVATLKARVKAVYGIDCE